MSEQVSGLLIHVTITPPWLLRPVKVSTSPGPYPNCFGCILFLTVQESSFLRFTSLLLTQSVTLPLVTYPSLCSAYVAYKTPCNVSGHQALPTQPLSREAEDFPKDDNHSKHVPLLTYLARLQPIYYDLGFVFIHVKLRIVLFMVKILIKKG